MQIILEFLNFYFMGCFEQLYHDVIDIEKIGIQLMHAVWWVWRYVYIHETITTIKVIDIPNTSKSFLLSNRFALFCFACVVRTFDMRSTFNKFLGLQYWIFSYRHYVVSGSLELIHLAYLKLYTHWIATTSLPPTQSPWQPPFCSPFLCVSLF